MSYSIGQFVGGILGIAILCLVLRLVTRRFLQGPALVLATVAVAIVVAVILNAFGSAAGGRPNFADGIAPYSFGGVVIAAVWLLALKGRATNG